jgi:transposase
MKPVGKPDAGNPHVRFDERGGETGLAPTAQEPRLSSTLQIKGRKRHALVDTDGRGLVLEPHPASIQDRDGGGALLKASRRIFPFIDRVFADGGYAGKRVATATRIIVEIVNKHLDQVGFTVLPRRWVVERFFAWIGRNRRLAKDFEATIASARAFLYAASIMLLSRRMARAV